MAIDTSQDATDTKLPRREDTLGKPFETPLGPKNALDDIDRFREGKPNPDQTDGRRTDTTVYGKQLQREPGASGIFEEVTTIKTQDQGKSFQGLSDEVRASKGPTPITLEDSFGIYGKPTAEAGKAETGNPFTTTEQDKKPKQDTMSREEGLKSLLHDATPDIPFFKGAAIDKALKQIGSYDKPGEGQGELSLKEAEAARNDIAQAIAGLSPEKQKNIIATLDKFPEKPDSNIFRDPATGKMPLTGLKISAEVAGMLDETVRDVADPKRRAAKAEKEKQEAITNASALDLDGKNGVSVAEAKESAKKLTDGASRWPAALKEAYLKDYESRQKNDPTGEKEAKEYEGLTKKPMEPAAALAVREARLAGAKLENPDSAIAEAEKKEKEAAKDPKKEKNFFQMIVELIKSFAVALGIMDDPSKKDTAVAEEKPVYIQPKGKELALSPEELEKTRIAEAKEKGDFATMFGADLQNKIVLAGKQANSTGAEHTTAEYKGEAPRSQNIGVIKMDASAGLGA